MSGSHHHMVEIIIQRTLFPSRSTSIHWFAGVSLIIVNNGANQCFVPSIGLYWRWRNKLEPWVRLHHSSLMIELQLSEGKIEKKKKCCRNNWSLSLARTCYFIYVGFDWFIEIIKYFCTMHTKLLFVVIHDSPPVFLSVFVSVSCSNCPHSPLLCCNTFLCSPTAQG